MTKQYKLKPGRHQFAPGSHAIHHNGNLNDQEAKWYLKMYPHIASLFVTKTGDSIANATEAATDKDRSVCRVSGRDANFQNDKTAGDTGGVIKPQQYNEDIPATD